MHEEHDRADLGVVVVVRDADECNGHYMVQVHDEVVLVTLLEESMAEARVDPDGHLEHVEQLDGLGSLRAQAVLRVRVRHPQVRVV